MQSSTGILPMRNRGTESLQNLLLKVLSQEVKEFRLKPRSDSKAQTLNHDSTLPKKDSLSLHPNSRSSKAPRDQKTTNTNVKTCTPTPRVLPIFCVFASWCLSGEEGGGLYILFQNRMLFYFFLIISVWEYGFKLLLAPWDLLRVLREPAASFSISTSYPAWSQWT